MYYDKSSNNNTKGFIQPSPCRAEPLLCNVSLLYQSGFPYPSLNGFAVVISFRLKYPGLHTRSICSPTAISATVHLSTHSHLPIAISPIPLCYHLSSIQCLEKKTNKALAYVNGHYEIKFHVIYKRTLN